MDQVTKDTILTETTKQAIHEYSEDGTEHSTLMVTVKDLLVLVWQRIYTHKDADEMKRIMNQEMSDSICKCFTGRLGRLVNVLNGFYDDIQVTLSENEGIGNVIVMIKEGLGSEYTIERHKELAQKELAERGYDQETIDLWLEFIE